MRNSSHGVLAKNRYSKKLSNLEASKEFSLPCKCWYQITQTQREQTGKVDTHNSLNLCTSFQYRVVNFFPDTAKRTTDVPLTCI